MIHIQSSNRRYLYQNLEHIEPRCCQLVSKETYIGLMALLGSSLPPEAVLAEA
jgi:hypothetical protein